uniref:Organic solute transporter alpha-like protein n=1 Tax=Panagrellus redivivus TaxID=6233 RepID=A0A7E4VYI1_PANRE
MDLFINMVKNNKINMSLLDIPPTMDVWMNNIEAHYVVCIGIGLFLTLMTLMISFVHFYFVYHYVSSLLIQADLYWLIFMCPIIGACGCVGMLVPRAATFMYAVALVYFMLCIFISVTLMTSLLGGREALCERLLKHDKKINMRILPLGCFLFCVPKLAPTNKTFRRIEWLVFQSPVLRIGMEVLNVAVYMEKGNRGSIFFTITNVCGIISLFVASWGSYMIIPLGSAYLKNYRYLLLFRIIDLSQLLYSVQKIVFEFMAGIDIISSDNNLPAASKATYWISFLLTIEMFIISLIYTVCFRPSKTAFFDKFGDRRNHLSNRPHTSAETVNIEELTTGEFVNESGDDGNSSKYSSRQHDPSIEPNSNRSSIRERRKSDAESKASSIVADTGFAKDFEKY